MNAPGSPSSPLQTTYDFPPLLAAVNFHLVPVGKPPPPLPLSPDFSISEITASGLFSFKTLERAS